MVVPLSSQSKAKLAPRRRERRIVALVALRCPFECGGGSSLIAQEQMRFGFRRRRIVGILPARADALERGPREQARALAGAPATRLRLPALIAG